MIITDIEQLRKKCEPVSSIEEGEKLGKQLIEELAKSKNGIGLAANQIGINKQVCVIDVKDTIIFINPRITESSKDFFVCPEGCLSFPDGEQILTERHTWVKVEADNHEGTLYFTADGGTVDGAFECACVQHEIDHLNGILHLDRKHLVIPYKAPKKIGRNEKVTITNGKETRILKYKKAKSLLEVDWKFLDIQIPDPENAHDPD